MPVIDPTASRSPANTLSINTSILTHPAPGIGDVGVSHHAECIGALAILLAATDLTIMR